MKMIGFCGSPRRKGNTEILMQTILDEAESNGFDTEMVYLADADIGFCKACDACHLPSGKCIIDDDMESLVQKMKESDVWVLGTPVYWWGPTAQMKVFIDRWYGFYSEELFKNKKAILVVPMEDSEEKTASHVVGMFQDSCDYVGLELADIIVAKGVRNKGDVKEKPELMKQAKDSVSKITAQAKTTMKTKN
ncbi:putative NAD(P)H-dependent FMN-containing oxidoreductase YwqN [Methanosarcinaceae archaeon Ag5]|uniref:NAD(P)H-dependent FMN-containing oxidoreductase YwqN n=1 Tax=Methanolapillus africanus TaxID=3028297 RepID=A0AAE4MIS0_9EURY|nr:putative NAD(P)H-dependent FMN-containing oxidoreductase YwqN [Methanosarcinaceae archaeon Ag5]